MSDLLVQTYRDYEIVLVDDGSTDTTPDICDSYREKYEPCRPGGSQKRDCQVAVY